MQDSTIDDVLVSSSALSFENIVIALNIWFADGNRQKVESANTKESYPYTIGCRRSLLTLLLRYVLVSGASSYAAACRSFWILASTYTYLDPGG